MSPDVVQERQQVHAYLDRLPPAQLGAVRSLLEIMLPDSVSRALANAPLEDEAISEEENQAAARSREWFKTTRAPLSKMWWLIWAWTRSATPRNQLEADSFLRRS
jgi:hypothetical protein